MPRRSGEITFEQFAGLNNAQDPKDLGAGELQAAVNVDFTDKGRAARRAGRTRIYSGETDNLFTVTPTTAFFTDAGVLKRLTRAVDGTYSFETLRSGLMPGRRMGYAEVNGDVYYSDGLVTGMVPAGGASRPWGMRSPTGAPTLSAISGALAPGRYQVVCTFVDDEGFESGCYAARQINLTSKGGIRASGLPLSGESHVVAVRVYMTMTNGEDFYFARQVTHGTTSVDLTVFLGTVPLETQFLDAPPPGDQLEFHDGRIWIVNGSYLYKTRPLQYHLYKPDEDYHAFPAPVTGFVSVDGGAYVSADVIYWMAAGEGGEGLVTVMEDQIVQGTVCRVNGTDVGEGAAGEHVMFYGKKGLYLAAPGGAIRNLTAGRVEFGRLLAGAQAAVTTANGKFAIASHNPGFAASDNAEIEIRRNGIVI